MSKIVQHFTAVLYFYCNHLSLILLTLYLHCITDQIYSFIVCLFVSFHFLIVLNHFNWYYIMCISMLWYYTTVSGKGRSCGTNNMFNSAAIVCVCPEFDVHWLPFVYVVHKCFSFLVFLYRLVNWFSRFNDFTLIILGTFIACCSVLVYAPCWRPYIDLWWFTFINCDLDWELSH